jgi:hypothetical protein
MQSFSTRDSLLHEDYELLLKTAYQKGSLDSVDCTETTLVVSQELIFKKNGGVLRQQSWPSQRIHWRQNLRDTTLSVLENRVVSIGLCEGKHVDVFRVLGGGICASNSEILALYHLDGTLAFSSYATARNIAGNFPNDPLVVTGDMDSVMIAIGITEEQIANPDHEEIIGIP